MIQKINLYAMISEANETATYNGWHITEPKFSDYIALMVSELGEAVQELRTNADATRWLVQPDGKLEGFPVELADVCIRIMDFSGQVGHTVKRAERVVVSSAQTACQKALDVESAPSATELVCVVGEILFGSWRTMLDQDLVRVLATLGMAIGITDAWFIRNGLSLEDVMREKMAYNKTRGYRHGGKLL